MTACHVCCCTLHTIVNGGTSVMIMLVTHIEVCYPCIQITARFIQGQFQEDGNEQIISHTSVPKIQ